MVIMAWIIVGLFMLGCSIALLVRVIKWLAQFFYALAPYVFLLITSVGLVLLYDYAKRGEIGNDTQETQDTSEGH